MRNACDFLLFLSLSHLSSFRQPIFQHAPNPSTKSRYGAPSSHWQKPLKQSDLIVTQYPACPGSLKESTPWTNPNLLRQFCAINRASLLGFSYFARTSLPITHRKELPIGSRCVFVGMGQKTPPIFMARGGECLKRNPEHPTNTRLTIFLLQLFQPYWINLLFLQARMGWTGS